MPKQRAHQQGDICYQTGLHWRTLVHLTRMGSGKAGHRLTEIRVQLKDEGVLIMLKKKTPKGPEIAFVRADSFDKCVWAMSREIKAKTLKWRVDRFAAMRSDKPVKTGYTERPPRGK